MENELSILLRKFKKGQLSLKDELMLAEKLSKPAEVESEQYMKSDFKEKLENYRTPVKKDFTDLLHQVHHQIHLLDSQKKKSKRYQLMKWTSRVAAILFLPVLIFTTIYWYQSKSDSQQSSLIEIITPAGSRVQFELPDGTIGTLNSKSRIQYASVFKKNREVKLEGEAYFDVAHDCKHPFRISANENTIKVVGTKFTITADRTEKLTELVLEEGKVLFKSPKYRNAINLLPGDRIVSKDGKLEQTKVEAWKYTAWKDGKLIFRNESMQELSNRISRWYNVDVEIEGSSLSDYTFRGVFEDDTLEEVLSYLQMTSPIKFKIERRKELADGSFSRKKVILSKK